MNHWLAPVLAATLIAVLVGALATFSLGVLLTVLSLTLVVPDSAWSGPIIIALGALGFAIAFTVTFHEMREKFTR